MPRSKHRKKPARSKRSRSTSNRGTLRPSSNDLQMSDVIFDFIKPYKKLAQDNSDLQMLVVAGIVAWNISLLPVEEREHALNNFTANLLSMINPIDQPSSLTATSEPTGQEMESADVTEFKQFAYDMIEHKLRCFPDNRRMILKYQMEMDGEDLHLVVASTLEGSKKGV